MSAPRDSNATVQVPRLATAVHLFARHRKSPGRARDALRIQLARWQVDSRTAETAVLLLSELVTNAVCHGRVPPGRRVGTRLTLGGGCLRIEVADANDDLPLPRTAGEDDESGRGLALVDALADGWGTYRRAGGVGKCVWVELRLPAGRG
ncbi:ATP-binding protein [Streptomyces sp. NBC_01808]|uniref:ATP-binding protein n=1 Tax=Streptomyces sp. NBC_01808 TaxID=2975947 RepID=UPI002DDA566C|nr:ATP-binding protein [Streptomyces sp. NBC_01808]WSA38590.1 ATP-binding protein [Streptomyces sp. NBC_01808]